MKPGTARIEKFLGLRSDVDPERMAIGDLIEALNVRLDESGRAQRRPGRTSVLSGVTHSLWGDGERAFGVIGGALRRINADYTTITLLSGLPGTPLHYEPLNERVYWTNGLQLGCIEGNTNRSWGLEVPPRIQATRVAGLLPAGRYQYTLTYMRADAQEGGAGLSNVIDLAADSGLQIVAPTATDVTHAVLYLSKAGSEVMYRAAVIAAGATGSYTNSGIDLVSPLGTQHMSPPVPASAIAYHAGRMWLGVGDSVVPSAAFSPELFDYRAELPVQGEVRMLMPLRNGAGMFVGTSTHTAFLPGGDPAAMELRPRHNEGVVAGALVYVPGKYFGEGKDEQDIPVWASPKGLYAGMSDGSVASLTHKRHPLALTGHGAGYFDEDLKTVLFSAA